MADWYQEHLVSTGRSAALWLLTGFLVTYGVTRWVTLRIRARTAPGAESGDSTIKDVYIGGVHIHHQVWGILLVLVVGLLEFRFRPDAPWVELLAVLFGVGAALALDEFELWLHLDDVYWSEESRKSIDAVMVAVVVVLHIGYTILCLLKGKLATGLIGLPVPLVALVGAVRLAKPSSFWARRFYSESKIVKATDRFGAEHEARRERLRDLFSGSR